MSDANPEPDATGEHAEALGAISAFLAILEVFPDDVSTLDALVHSYELVGDRPNAARHLARLVKALIDQDHVRQAAQYLAKLHDYLDADPGIVPLIERLQDVQPPEAPPPAPAVAAPPAGERAAGRPAQRGAALEDELSFAWHLHEAKLLNDVDYAGVVQDLTENSARAAAGTVSVLHALQDRTFRGLDGVLAFVARQTRLPLVPVSSFEPTEEACRVLPLDFAAERGAACFEVLQGEALVAVLNPYSEKLRQAVRERARRPCHFFMANAADFDAWLNRARDVAKKAGAPASGARGAAAASR